MNICYISNSAAPSKNASSLQIAKLCEGLSKFGHQVTLIKPNTGKSLNYYNFYNIRKKYKIIVIKYFNKFPRGINYYLYSIVSLLISNFNKYDIYITRNFFISIILSILAKKHLLEIHDDILIEGRIVQFLIRRLKFLNNKNLLKIITTTHTLKKRYVDYCKVKKEKIYVLHNASSLKPIFKKYKTKPKNINIGYFGSIYKSRGIEMIIKLSKIDQKNKYFIYGGTNIEINELKKKFKNKNLFFKSYVPYSKISNELKKIDLCILPYKSKITVAGNVGDISNYTSPLKIFDYMINGKLIVCSNLKVIREVLNNNKNSILIKNFESEKQWLLKVKLISKNFLKYSDIRLKAFNYAKKHNIDWRVKKLLSFINTN